MQYYLIKYVRIWIGLLSRGSFKTTLPLLD